MWSTSRFLAKILSRFSTFSSQTAHETDLHRIEIPLEFHMLSSGRNKSNYILLTIILHYHCHRHHLKLKLQEQFTALPFGLMSLSLVCLLIYIPQMNSCFNTDIFRDQQHSVAFNRPNPATYTLVPGKGVPKTNMTPSFAFPSHGVEFLFRCAVFSRSPSSPSKDR